MTYNITVTLPIFLRTKSQLTLLESSNTYRYTRFSLFFSKFLFPLLSPISSGGIKGDMGGAYASPVGGSAPSLAPQSEEKNGQNQPFLGKFLDFCPLRIAFCPLDAPHKKFLGLPLPISIDLMKNIDIWKLKELLQLVNWRFQTQGGHSDCNYFSVWSVR